MDCSGPAHLPVRSFKRDSDVRAPRALERAVRPFALERGRPEVDVREPMGEWGDHPLLLGGLDRGGLRGRGEAEEGAGRGGVRVKFHARTILATRRLSSWIDEEISRSEAGRRPD